MTDLHHESTAMTVQSIVDLYKGGRLNLNPGFQRKSVWQERDRAKLIDSIVRNYPLPAIFLYRRKVDGELVYDVVDGKQRLESILMFTGVMRGGRFQAKLSLPGLEEDWWDWRNILNKKMQHVIMGYKILVIEVDGEQSDITDLFVRINSTGKALTAAERRHARYYNSNFLKTAGRLAVKYEKWLRQNGVFTTGQMNRMKHVELMSELMLSVHLGDVTNKKMALDKAMQADSMTAIQVKRAQSDVIRALNRLAKMFPRLKSTRFRQVTDFYSLAFLIAQFESERRILTDKRRNTLAQDILVTFSVGVDMVRDRQKHARGSKQGQELYRDYLMTVTQATDEISQRRKRMEILRGLMESLFEKKDSKRTFSPEQRRILWNTTVERKCEECGKRLTWEDFTIDHIDPYSKGGKTRLDNAALLCRQHNATKGNRRGRR